MKMFRIRHRTRCWLQGLTLSAFAMLTPRQSLAYHWLAFDEITAPSFDERFSTNWQMEVRKALPAKYFDRGDLNFQETTNDLCNESRQGNVAAQALWGFTLIVQSHSRDTTDTGLQFLRGSAEKGYVPAMLNLGSIFEGGQFVRRNYNEAFHWFSQAAELGDPEAQHQVGVCYHRGFGVTPNFTMAAKFYQLAADQTNFAAMKNLGLLLMEGKGLEENDDKAKYWLLRAATEGQNRRAMYDLSVLYCRKLQDTNSMIEAFSWAKQSAALGDPLGAYDLAGFYLNGWGATETNLANYRQWLQIAALRGATDAQYFLGQAYWTGDGMPKDVRTSLVWMKKAAAKNHPDALYALAAYYSEDRTNPESLYLADKFFLQAAKMGHREAQFQYAISRFRGDLVVDCDGGTMWLEKAAENGWPKAEYLLFQFYYNGLPPGRNCPAFTQDKTEAVKWLRRAAEHGNLQAQATLAVMLIRGLDVNQDKAAGEKFLRDAAVHGFAAAQNDLGFAIADGDTATRDMVEAGMWCKLATGSNDPNISDHAAVNLSHIMQSLALDQQDAVDSRANNFHALPVPEMDSKIKGWESNTDYHMEDDQIGH